MKYAILLAMTLIGLNSHAQASLKIDLTCKTPDLQDSQTIVHFSNVFVEDSTVSLTLPSGETKTQVLTGELKRQVGVIRAYRANFSTSTDSGYEVLVVPAPGNKLVAIVKAWSMTPSAQEPEFLPCK